MDRGQTLKRKMRTRLGAMEIRIIHLHPREGTSSIPRRTMSTEPVIQKTCKTRTWSWAWTWSPTLDLELELDLKLDSRPGAGL